jgi:cellulose biosynthesis protein BcsQ
MTAKVVAVANMKGGVGKTTTVVALAEYLAAYGLRGEGKNVAVLDLDAQASASISIAGNDLLRELILSGKTIDAFLEDRIVHHLNTPTLSSLLRPFASTLTASGHPISLSLIASSPELRMVEREMICALTEQGYGLRAIEGKTRQLTEPQIVRLQNELDYILVDCPPGISAFTEVMFAVADMVLTPVIPDFVSTRGLASFCRNVASVGADGKLPHVLINRYSNTRHQKETLEALKQDAKAAPPPFILFDTIVQQRADIQAALEEQPGATFESRWGVDAAETYKQVAEEVAERLHA